MRYRAYKKSITREILSSKARFASILVIILLGVAFFSGIKSSGPDMNKAINEKNYDLALVGWELSLVPDATNILESIGYEDEKLTNYINSLKNATTESQISDIYKSIQKYVNENALFMSLVIRYDYIVTNRRIEGKISPNSFDIYEGITNLDIAK